MNKTLKSPREFSDLIDSVCAIDAAYFEDHPEVEVYERPYTPGEFWPYFFSLSSQVRVTLIAPGIRTRQPLLVVQDIDKYGDN